MRANGDFSVLTSPGISHPNIVTRNGTTYRFENWPLWQKTKKRSLKIRSPRITCSRLWAFKNVQNAGQWRSEKTKKMWGYVARCAVRRTVKRTNSAGTVWRSGIIKTAELSVVRLLWYTTEYIKDGNLNCGIKIKNIHIKMKNYIERDISGTLEQ